MVTMPLRQIGLVSLCVLVGAAAARAETPAQFDAQIAVNQAAHDWILDADAPWPASWASVEYTA
ncbi:hypothetical protein [Consotaella salsifontis]|uniref:Uncharacterized protein n=1 Tax=Consotaella salsifontis TaxID=1365950 RepID=A0A1T4RL02_9HYPH|nr:hypothetical protein [Consotaella salsifontis]SKA16680.1 hypothetical protein SAMN05428963_10739 [Consotaella salsifontis]